MRWARHNFSRWYRTGLPSDSERLADYQALKKGREPMESQADRDKGDAIRARLRDGADEKGTPTSTCSGDGDGDGDPRGASAGAGIGDGFEAKDGEAETCYAAALFESGDDW
jgi:hypothetical protein